MFSGCWSLSGINPYKIGMLQGKNFAYMFFDCSSLSDIKYMQNLNVSKSENFAYMFFGCSPLLDISQIKKWKISEYNFKKLKK